MFSFARCTCAYVTVRCRAGALASFSVFLTEPIGFDCYGGSLRHMLLGHIRVHSLSACMVAA